MAVATRQPASSGLLVLASRERPVAAEEQLDRELRALDPVLRERAVGARVRVREDQREQHAYLPFMLIGMIANTLYQGTITGVTNLVEERENDFTAELFVAPVSRYTVLHGQDARLGGRRDDRADRRPRDDLRDADPDGPGRPAPRARRCRRSSRSRVARSGILFIGFVQDPKVAGLGVVLLVFPQMFLSGALIPCSNSTGLLGILSKLMPMTYSIDLARNMPGTRAGSEYSGRALPMAPVSGSRPGGGRRLHRPDGTPGVPGGDDNRHAATATADARSERVRFHERRRATRQSAR